MPASASPRRSSSWSPGPLRACRSGGEFSTSAAFLVEFAPRDRRGFYGSFTYGSAIMGSTLGVALVFGLTSALGPGAMLSFGWRIPFLLSFPLLLIGFYLRYRLSDTPHFQQVRRARSAGPAPSGENLWTHKKAMFQVLFDVPGFSLLDTAAANGFAAVALDRPGYGGADPLPPDQRTFARNAEVLDEAIAAIWKQHNAGRPGVVIVAHSIGSAIAVHLAARGPAWPLLGIALHGIHVSSPEHVVGAWHAMPPGVPVRFSPDQRRQFMYGPDGTFAPDAVERAAPSTAPCPIEDPLEIVGEWPRSAADLAAQVRVPVQIVLAEHEAL